MKGARNLQHLNAFKKTENSRNFFKKICLQNINKSKHTHNFYNYFSFYKKPSSLIRYKSYCTLTNKPRSVFRKFKLARIALRELTSFGLIYGLRKASW